MPSNTEIYFFDESRFGTHSNIGHGWFKIGKHRDFIKYKMGYKNFYLYSAIAPLSGNNFSLIMPNVDTNNFNAYLREFAKYLESIGKKAIFVMDGAGWHRSKSLECPDNIEFIIQPAYSPELNPAEKLWQYIKRHTIKNKIFKTLTEIENELCLFIKNITKEKYKTVCRAQYIINT